MTYLHSQKHKHYVDIRTLVQDVMRGSEHIEMEIDWDIAEENDRNIVRECRMRIGILRKGQL